MFYCGYTKNIENRLIEHIKGNNKSTKRWKGNLKLGYLEQFDSRAKAMAREREIKTFTRKKKIQIINSELNLFLIK
jgi:putative endonuclease